MYKTLDLFAGAGGITEGFRKSGYKCVLASDIDPEAQHTFLFNHPNTPYILSDVREITEENIWKISKCKKEEIDIITGGPPCQGFSLAGLRLADDPRNMLFREYIRITDIVKPKVIFFENVYGITSMQGGKVLKAIISEFETIGYKCEYRLVNSADYGVPQSRPRFVLIGVRGKNIKISFPEPTHAPNNSNDLLQKGLIPYITVEEAIGDLPVIDQGEGEEIMQMTNTYQSEYSRARRGDRKPGVMYNHRATKHSKIVQDRYAMIPQGYTNAVLPEEIRTKKQNAYKLAMLQTSRTVTCNFRTDLIHPIMNRGLTVREAARLQSFDDDYCFFGNLTRKAKWLTQDDQVGNAVPPLMAQAFADHIKRVILPQFDREE